MESLLLALVFVYIAYRLLDRLLRLPRLGKLDSRYIFITGCDSGFGFATCKKLDRLGCHVFAGCLTEKGEVELKKSCSERLVPVRLDVTNHDSVVKAFETVKGKLPSGKGLWGLINNAGIAGKIGPSEWLTKADYDQVFNVNLHGLIDMTTTFLPLLKKAKGRVVNTASVFGRFSLIGSAPYCISKYGVECFSDALRREMRVFQVSVHIIEPGFHRTNITDVNMLKNSLESAWDQLPQHYKEEYGRQFVDKSIEQLLKNFVSGVIAEDISPVVDGYTHALTAMCPRGRYVIGTDAKLLWIPLTWLPEWLSDLLIEQMARDRPIPAALQK